MALHVFQRVFIAVFVMSLMHACQGFCVRGAYACLCSSSVIEQQVLFCKVKKG
eukprot:CAMPEP_0202370070 /NCGR_PEP_ID=MMETSP1127-20130417/1772_1 /ASSEMBLY_ACC=CAM_ASM_000462 /TAXON_ID=3047 /ORGANISM="Dunaliella tertiolecta, Strain CCMP1320" /LENGTH=52 /DNA_ID=CAMNT_0048965919 /DNA_START=779 /DNA_END=937 /DNA_ORIENTATION=+